ncbi:uncharacterized protein N7483_003280 [Penicillium malachiteum]|uniref:uncharacterized protein n=1 Tax=Penicillium malachiteum TaxID=1324776 RepID=UPI0025496ED7|nr:uncharacterized protein N7483_003280 [Penicillium malachiteum]KAJ5728772.1 hypothetical protein N7483_003280 [Penicillium malachiteum]
MAKKTHMDLKPSNVVVNGDGDAILIDVSAIGGITHEWRAPEFRDEIDTLDLSPQVLPELLEKYTRLMEDVCDEDEFDVSEEAEQDLQDWAMEPFLEIFEKLKLLSHWQDRVTLQDYLTPETYRYQIYGQEGRIQPVLDYAVPGEQMSDGIAISQEKLSPKWLSLYPEDIEIEHPSVDEAISRFPRKVSVKGTFYHFKPIYTGNQLAALREIDIYRRVEEVFSEEEIRVPFLHDVVRDKDNPVVIGFLLSWIECGNENLECILNSESETLSLPREQWWRQISHTIKRLHEAGIVWGDAKAANILIDSRSNDAWIIDYGGGFTNGWVKESQIETVDGTWQLFQK